MKKIIEFPDHHAIEREALDWLVKLDGDSEPSAEDLAALKEWMARSPAHTREMESLGAFLGDLIVLTELNIPLLKPELAGTSHENQKRSSQASWSLFPQKTWAMAAGVLGLAVLLQQVLLPGWLGGENFDSANGYYASAIGEQLTVPLSDGSTMQMNTNSQIKVEYTEDHRNIHLIKGEAHFDVAQNKQQPFRVFAGEGRVQAVGTAFTVYLNEKDIEVLVTEGKVELAAHKTQQKPPAAASQVPSEEPQGHDPNQDANTTLTKGEPEYYLTVPVKKLGLLTEGQGAVIVVAQNNDPDASEQKREVILMDESALKRRDAWRKGLLLFAGDSLEEVVAEISRYTEVSIEIVDPELKKIRIGGQFRVGDISGMFDVLEANFGLSITKLDNNRVQITAAEQ